jgi:hypothetical protein
MIAGIVDISHLSTGILNSRRMRAERMMVITTIRIVAMIWEFAASRCIEY